MSSSIHPIPTHPIREDLPEPWASVLPSLRGAGPRRLVVGTGPGLAAIEAEATRRANRGTVVGIIGRADADAPAKWPFLGPLSAFPGLLASGAIDEVALCLDDGEWSQCGAIVEACAAKGVGVSIAIPAARESAGAESVNRRFGMRAKRVMDVAGAVVGLVLLLPLLAATALTILVKDGRPILFRQRRAGLGGRPFWIAKFRTMERDADARRSALRATNEVSGGASFKMQNDPRVTVLGMWLRRLSIDELPQLWNVLKGEMSLVGPRPHPFDDVAGYRPWHLRRLSAKPGITGSWQIELRNDPDFDRWVDKDLDYIDRWSLALDFLIIVKTIPALVRGGR